MLRGSPGCISSERSWEPTQELSIRVIYQNIRSLMNKVELLKVFLDDETPDVFCLSEHSMKLFEIENLTILKLYLSVLLLQNADEQWRHRNLDSSRHRLWAL